ncbi:3-oxoacyl-[acyl-carrier-protein] synthase III C-terminal domain-containing protein [Mycobacterium heckeshornense]|uniref:3-oxoacyl-[acyl-carrier-protein] synthase III C-terminal domain-containing protein n=1 Tax=Mycobacterium heckeshornense TaxID=110505 RepID=UPI002E0D7FB1
MDAIIAAPGLPGYRAALATQLEVPAERITVAADEKIHTASLAAALHRTVDRLPAGSPVLLIAAGAGITAGAALYRQPHGPAPDEMG